MKKGDVVEIYPTGAIGKIIRVSEFGKSGYRIMLQGGITYIVHKSQVREVKGSKTKVGSLIWR